jgi:hypothetical protein
MANNKDTTSQHIPYNIYCNHIILHELGVGPRVHSFGKYDTRYGFFIEHCEIIESNDYYDEIDRIEKVINSYNMRTYDMGYPNFGYLNGKVVLVDGGCIGATGPYRSTCTCEI